MKDKYQSVFDCNPTAEYVYVVDGMPFLKAEHAQGHSITTGKPVETIARPIPAQAEGEAGEPSGAAPKAAAKKGRSKAK